eukprot:gene14775-18880_t
MQLRLLALALMLFTPLAAAPLTPITYPAQPGPGAGKRIVFLTGDEEYRGEEGLPMLAKILSQRYGFTCTVLFPLDPDGTINPDNNTSLSDPAALDTADGIVIDAPAQAASAASGQKNAVRARRALLNAATLDPGSRVALQIYRASAEVDPVLRLILAVPPSPAGPADWADYVLSPPASTAQALVADA